MRLTSLVCLLAICCGGASLASPPMPPLPPGMVLTSTAQCQDPKTLEHGLCAFWEDAAGNNYLMFGEGNELKFIRQFYMDTRPYVDLWVADGYGSI